MRVVFAAVMSVILLLPIMCFGQSKTIYNSSNVHVETWRQSGNRTDVYSDRNELMYSRYRDGDRVTIRTPDNEAHDVEYDD